MATQSPRMTLDDVLEDLRAHGMNIGKDVLSNCLKQGIFPFGHVVGSAPTGRACFLIMRLDYQRWAEEYVYPFAEG